MEYEIYQVVPGDTLGEIARRNDTDAETLAGVNGIDDPDKIYIGQQLKIPVDLYPDDEDFYNEQWICFVDPLGKPICNMKTRVVTASGEYRFTTDENGFIPPVRTQNKDDKPKVFVAKVQGGEKQVATLTAPAGVHQQTIRSPKQKISLPMRRHEGTPDHDPTKPVKLDPGQVQHNRNEEGHPVAAVGVECPNKENLKLGPNVKYREYILEAAQKSGFKPQAVAAVVNIEAAKKRTVVEKKFKVKGKEVIKKIPASTGEWDPNSSNSRSSAKGMTQFLKGTWLQEARRNGTYLNQKSVKNKWIEKNSNGQFQIPPEHEADILDLRMDAEAAIMAAVDYGLYNFNQLQSSGFDFSKLNDGERGKILYLCHHLGPGDAYRYLKGTIVDDDVRKELGHGKYTTILGAKTLLGAQVSSTEAKKRADANGGSYTKAHRYWLSGLIDKGVDFKNFACDPTKLDNTRPLLELVTAVGGVNLEF